MSKVNQYKECSEDPSNGTAEFSEHFKDMLAWIETKFKLIESEKLSVKLYVIKYLGFLDLLPASMPKWEKAFLLSLLFDRDKTAIRNRIPKITHRDSIETQIKHLTLVFELFSQLSLKEPAKAVERDLDKLVRRAHI